MRYHFTPTRMATIKKRKKKGGQDVKKMETLCTIGGNVKWFSCCRKHWQFLKNLKIKLPYNPTILLLNIYPKELKAGS